MRIRNYIIILLALLSTKTILALCENSAGISKFQDRATGIIYYYDTNTDNQKYICIIIDRTPDENLRQSLGLFAHNNDFNLPVLVLLKEQYFSYDKLIIAAGFELYFDNNIIRKYCIK